MNEHVVVVELKRKLTREERERMRVHTGKGVLLGSEGGDEGILLFLGWARWDWFGSRRRSDHGMRRHNLVNEGEVLLHGELWRSGDREILINWRKKKKEISKLIPSKSNSKKKKKKILINGEK